MTKETSAGSSLEGYFYQVRVSVWAALDLMLARKIADSITLEPANEEDLETLIDGEVDAGAVVLSAAGYTLAIQCKHRTTGPFNATDINRLLGHGKVREKPKNRLEATKNRYLLITDADLAGVARQLTVKQIGEWPSVIPSSVRSKLPTGVDGRLGILSALDNEKLCARIADLLQSRFRVPRLEIEACRATLEREALARMRGQSKGHWGREELEQVIIAHDGYVVSAEALDGYVKPTNWEDFKEALTARHAVVIVGASGTGKSRTGKALIAALRDTVPGIRHVFVDGGPEQVTGNTHGGDTVYEVEDPWGRYRLSPSALPWNDAIRPILESAGPGRKFVVTSRSDILKGADARVAERWIVHLEEENYGPEQRTALFERRLVFLPRRIQQMLVQHRKRAIDRLSTPLEMERFFSALLAGQEDAENEATYVERCLKEAHHTSIETALLNGIKAAESWSAAAATWGLFQVQPRLSFDVIPQVQAGLAKRDSALEDKLMPFLNFLVAGRNLRQVESTISFQHPRVEQGLESALSEKPNRASRVLGALVETLLDVDRRNHTDWGVEGAARVMLAASSHPFLALDVKPESQRNIDEWLEQRVTSLLKDSFLDDLHLAAEAGSPASDIAELARWLSSTGGKKEWFASNQWRKPQRLADWTKRIAANPATKLILDAFVRRAIPNRHLHFPDDFWVHLNELSGDLTHAFLAAALDIASSGYHDNDDVVAEGAIRDIEGFEAVVAAAIEHEADSAGRFDDDLALSLKNGEFDEAAAEHYYENAGEDTVTSSNFLARYVKEKRARGCWTDLRDHPLRDGLAWSWMRAAAKANDAGDDEWLAIAEAAHNLHYQAALWQEVGDNLPGVLISVLRRDLEAIILEADARRQMLLTALNGANEMLHQLFADLANGQLAKLLALAADLGDVLRDEPDRRTELSQAVERLLAELHATPAEVFRVLSGLAETPVSADALAVVEISPALTPQVELGRLRLLSTHGQDVGAPLLKLLRRTGDNSDAEIETVRDAVVLARSLGSRPALELALKHRFADVRREALSGLAEVTTGPLPPELLALANDKGNRVRKRLLELLSERRAVEHLETILVLAEDTFSTSQHYYGQKADYPIAQKASELLIEELRGVDMDMAQRLWEVAKKSEDADVKLRLLRVIARNGTDEVRGRLVRRAAGTGAPPYHRLAAQALLAEHEHLSNTIVDAISNESLNVRPAENVALLSLVLGLRGSESRVREAARSLSSNPDRRALVVLLIWMSIERSPKFADELLGLLPPDHVDPIANAFSDGPKIGPDLVDALGDVRVATEVKKWMKDIIAQPVGKT